MKPAETQVQSPTVKLTMLRVAWSEARWQSLNPGQAEDAELFTRHLWATAAQSAVMPAVTVLELTLRNALLTRTTELLAEAGWKAREVDLWFDAAPSLLREGDLKEFEKAKHRLKMRKGKLTVGRVVAELDLGFWTGLFDSYYEHSSASGARLWPQLRKKAFPGAPKGMQTRGDLSSHFRRLRDLRNAIVHHKHFWKHDGLLSVFDLFAETVGWMNRSAQIALVLSCREWVRILDDRGHAHFEQLSRSMQSRDSVEAPASKPSAPSIHPAGPSPLGAEEEDLPF